jgi:hypothetical protein
VRWNSDFGRVRRQRQNVPAQYIDARRASSNEFVYIAEAGSNNVSGYVIKTSNGALTRFRDRRLQQATIQPP